MSRFIGAVLLLGGCLAFAGCPQNNQVLLPPPGSLPFNMAVVNHISDAINGVGSVKYFSKSSTGNLAPVATLTNSGFTELAGIARDSSGNLYIGVNLDDESGTAGTCSGKILVFAPNSTGAATPIRTISGSTNTTLNDGIHGLAVDSSGNLYVTQDHSVGDTCEAANAKLAAHVSVFGPAANGDVAPIRQIFTPADFFATDLNGVALDGSGNVWVAQDDSFIVPAGSVYQLPNTAGTPAPIKTLTGVNEPIGVAIDASGNAYVVDSNNPTESVLVYDSGTTTPNAAKTITGLATKLCHPKYITLDSGSIYVTNGEVSGGLACDDPNFIGILVWNIGDAGNVAPRRTIAGSSTGFDTPVGLVSY